MAIASPANPTSQPLVDGRTRLWAVTLVAAGVLGGVLVALLDGLGGVWPAGVGAGSSLAATVWVATTDLRHRIIPNTATITLALVFTATAVLAVVTSTCSWTDLARAATATGIMAAVQLALFLLGATSPGDVKLAAALMIPAGLISWPAVVAVAVLPYFLALPEALVKALRRGKGAGVAFGPYLAVASAVVLTAVVAGVW